METQKFKSVSIREIVDCALHGKPINVQSRELFDLSDIDVDDERYIADEFSDPLEVESYLRHVAEVNFSSNYGKNEENTKQSEKSDKYQKSAESSESSEAQQKQQEIPSSD